MKPKHGGQRTGAGRKPKAANLRPDYGATKEDRIVQSIQIFCSVVEPILRRKGTPSYLLDDLFLLVFAITQPSQFDLISGGISWAATVNSRNAISPLVKDPTGSAPVSDIARQALFLAHLFAVGPRQFIDAIDTIEKSIRSAEMQSKYRAALLYRARHDGEKATVVADELTVLNKALFPHGETITSSAVKNARELRRKALH